MKKSAFLSSIADDEKALQFVKIKIYLKFRLSPMNQSFSASSSISVQVTCSMRPSSQALAIS